MNNEIVNNGYCDIYSLDESGGGDGGGSNGRGNDPEEPIDIPGYLIPILLIVFGCISILSIRKITFIKNLIQ